ncbi:MAG: hypothetical protein RIB32_01915 [Phycisphaerales bacterium]
MKARLIRMRGGTRRGGALAGCLIALGVVLVLLIAGGVFVALNWRGWTAGAMESGLVTMVEDSDLSNTEKSEVIVEVKRLTSAFRAGDVTVEELGRIFEELAESPLLAAVVVYGTSKEYVDPSGLSEEEKAQAKITLSRLTRGAIEEKITFEELEAVLEPMHAEPGANTGPDYRIDLGDGRRIELKPPSETSDDDLRAMLANAAAKADEAGIEAAPSEIDASAEISQAIERALGRALPAGAAPSGEDSGAEADDGP